MQGGTAAGPPLPARAWTPFAGCRVSPDVLSQARIREAPIKIALVCHASAVIETADAVVWSDPWLSGTAFNDSWALLPPPPPGLPEAWIPKVTHLFISHEHPDH